MKIGCHVQTWGAVRGHPAGSQSLKDFVLLSRAPFHRALKEIALCGYDGVEAFDGDVLAWHAAGLDVRRQGLELSGVYTAAQFIYGDVWPDEVARLQGVIDASASLGAANLVVGGGAVRAGGVRADDPAILADRLSEVADMAERRGVTAHFHPHPHPEGYAAEHLDEILRRTPIRVCPDLAVLVKGGVDPVAFARAHAGRIAYVHLKDIRDGEDVEVGQGTIDMRGVVEALARAGFDGWLVAELDASETTPMESARSMLHVIRSDLAPRATAPAGHLRAGR